MVYEPSALVTVLYDLPVAGFESSTTAPGITAPVVSVTMPVMVAVEVVACADDLVVVASVKNAATERRRRGRARFSLINLLLLKIRVTVVMCVHSERRFTSGAVVIRAEKYGRAGE